MDNPQPPIDDPGRRRLPPLLRRCWYGLNQAFRKRLATHGLTPNQFTVLRWLEEAGRGGMRQSEICSLMASDPNTIAALVERMRSDGLLRRKTDPRDRRARLVSVTPKGRRAYARSRPVAMELQQQVLSAIPSGERERFLKQLECLAGACQAALEDESEPTGKSR
ncbi:MarR family winged helix-turn-helix transcriptional regulator [Phycisphaeraceae bacterium D3-23]